MKFIYTFIILLFLVSCSEPISHKELQIMLNQTYQVEIPSNFLVTQHEGTSTIGDAVVTAVVPDEADWSELTFHGPVVGHQEVHHGQLGRGGLDPRSSGARSPPPSCA